MMKNHSRLSLLLVFSVLAFFVHGCEGTFVGKREFDVKSINGPATMKITPPLNGTTYLAVLNTNFHYEKVGGSLQFYSLANPVIPARVDTLTVSTPSNSSDFLIEGNVLYLIDRNVNQVLIYDFASSGAFVQRLDPNGNAIILNVTGDPQRLLTFSRASDGIRILAVLCQSAGSIQFFRLDTLQAVVTPEVDPPANILADTQNLGNGKVGTKFYMTPRQVEVPGHDDNIALTFLETQGVGSNDLVYLGGNNELIFTAAFTTTGIFGYQFKTFFNSSNFAWDLGQFRDGYTDASGMDIPGTGENGFRGLAADGAGTIFLTSRADNGLYAVPLSILDQPKESDSRNTRGFPANAQRFRLPINFDPNQTFNFPKLGQLALDCPPVTGCAQNQAAKIAWIVGFGTNKVYRVDLTNELLTATSADGAVDPSPQRVTWYPTAGFIYVASPAADKITILNDATLAVVGKLSN